MTDVCKRVLLSALAAWALSGIARVAADAGMRVRRLRHEVVALYRRPGCRGHSYFHRP